ncbi:ResB-like family cytochrome C biogenesis protein [Geomonas silvestris]|uniref:ResB-like family cytochrome C biogenesis protein n=1 Tax=Geomonas silvestris TaxID=2740184 RepID=A0A6V8MM55_9BACT|nr:cytochrome c biogenesis protein ResB [Geomonas silvestris]GFO60937.1 ResB-like family cytochrome C biogenesis protein [Geomonas silvestris]
MKALNFLTSRKTVLSLLAAITLALLEAVLVPQREGAGGKLPAWLEKLPGPLRETAGFLGLDNVVGSWWFMLLIAFFGLSLLLSTWNQFLAVASQLKRPPRPDAVPDGVRLPGDLAGLAPRLAQAGYRPSGSSGEVHRFVKHRAGYWGNFLLHLGLVVAVIFSLSYVVTQHRVFLRLVSGETVAPNPENSAEILGALRFRRPLPAQITLERVEPSFYPNDKLAGLGSRLSLKQAPGGAAQRVEVALSDKSQFGPFLVYQANSFGRAFLLEFTSPYRQGLARERLLIPYPQRRDKAGYGEIPLKEEGLVLKGKFYADPQKKGLKLARSPLFLRLYRGQELLGVASLNAGGLGNLGPLTVRLAGEAWWTDILLDGSRGTSGIFAGFAVILFGVLFSYCLVPREILVREGEGELYLRHSARRFAQLYREEFEAIVGEHRNTKEGEP